MTTEDVAQEFRFAEPRLARRWLEQERVQPFKRGRINLYRREDVEGALRVTRVMKAAR
jgi:hypothetical protein